MPRASFALKNCPFLILLGTAFLFASLPVSGAQAAHKPTKKFLIVIDPGHGGPDTGATYHQKGAKNEPTQIFYEKDLTLLLARDVARELVIRGNDVILTRNDDRDILLSDRTALANHLKADVFLSIHLNSSPTKIRSGGVETFILNHATDETSKRLADLENSVLKDSQATNNSGSGDVSLIMKDLILDGNIEPSRELACDVQTHLKTSTRDRGIKQALFYVLLGADMPSILIESGFMNAAADRQRINNAQSRLKIAEQIASGIDDYKNKKNPKHCKVKSEDQFKRDDEPTGHKRKI